MYYRRYNPHYWKCDPNRYPQWYIEDYKSTTKDIMFALKHLSSTQDAAMDINSFVQLHPELKKHFTPFKDVDKVTLGTIKKTWNSFFPKFILPKVCW